MASGETGAGDGIRKPRAAIGETIIAVGVLLLAAVVYWQTTLIPVSPIYAKVGPTVIPTITAVGLAVLGALLLFSALTGGWRSPQEREITSDRRALLWIAAGLVFNVLLIGSEGFTIASMVLFVCVARGFGSHAIVRDTAIGAAFALVAYFGFAQTLGINIGAGIVENAIQGVLGMGHGR